MDENKTTPAAPETPAAPKKVRRVGRVAFALLLILAGVLLLVQQFVPQFDLIGLVRFAPAILIVLGVELLVYSARPDIKVKFDWLSVIGCAFILVIVGGASVLPYLWSVAGPERSYAQAYYNGQIQQQAYQALNGDTDLKAKINSLYASTYFHTRTDSDYTLQDGDEVYLYVELLPNGYTDAVTFAKDCLAITQYLEQADVPVTEYQFDSTTGVSDTGTHYSLHYLDSFAEGLTAEQLAQRVQAQYQFEGNVYSTQADRDNAARAELRERVIARYKNDHGDDAWPGDEYINEQVEKEFNALFPTLTADVPATAESALPAAATGDTTSAAPAAPALEQAAPAAPEVPRL